MLAELFCRSAQPDEWGVVLEVPRLLQQREPDCSSSSNSSSNSSRIISADICLDLLSEGCYCPLSGSLLGAALLKQRQLQQLGFLYCSIRRQQWLHASAVEQQQLLLHALLVATGEGKNNVCSSHSY
ncbi:hypothetical protein ACSSS7_005970 [Eimeria intestinalis]